MSIQSRALNAPDGIGKTLAPTMKYLTCCVESTGAKIHAMIDQAKEISYRTARRAIGGSEFDRWAKTMSYDIGSERGGLRIKDDWHVQYARSVYDGVPCVYVRHSAIEYIFIGEKN